MDAIILPVALAAAAACALINFWLAIRVGQVRRAERISIGDGGSERLTARMRAQLNFAEYAPFVLILLALVELAVGTHWWLWGAAGLFVIGRILHPIGMDGVWKPGRPIGIALTLLVLLGLAGVAATIPWFSYGAVETIEVVETGRAESSPRLTSSASFTAYHADIRSDRIAAEQIDQILLD